MGEAGREAFTVLALVRPEAAVFCTHRLMSAGAMVFSTVAGPWELFLEALHRCFKPPNAKQ